MKASFFLRRPRGAAREGVNEGPADRGGKLSVTRARPVRGAHAPGQHSARPLAAPRARLLGTQRPALFPRLCFKYLTVIPPIPAPNPWPGCRRGTRAHCGAERGAKGAGGGCPVGDARVSPS